MENENSKIKEENENLNKKKELKSNINLLKFKNDKLLSEIYNKSLLEELNKNFEKLLKKKKIMKINYLLFFLKIIYFKKYFNHSYIFIFLFNFSLLPCLILRY